MELPNIGKHCALTECNRLDFLPIKCSFCENIYCSEHYKYQLHHCESNKLNDHQIPICPLCNKPVSLKYGESLDLKVNEHIERGCDGYFNTKTSTTTNTNTNNKIYKNRCSFNGCKQKELIRIECDKCKLNYCLKHRHSSDHECSGINDRKNDTNTLSGSTKWLHPLVKRYDNLFNNSNNNTNDNNRPTTAQKSQSIPQSLNTFTNTIDQIKSSVQRTFQRTEQTRTETINHQSGNRLNNNNRESINASINQLQGDLSEEEALNIAIAESMSQQQPQPGHSNQESNDNERNCKIF